MRKFEGFTIDELFAILVGLQKVKGYEQLKILLSQEIESEINTRFVEIELDYLLNKKECPI